MAVIFFSVFGRSLAYCPWLINDDMDGVLLCEQVTRYPCLAVIGDCSVTLMCYRIELQVTQCLRICIVAARIVLRRVKDVHLPYLSHYYASILRKCPPSDFRYRPSTNICFQAQPHVLSKINPYFEIDVFITPALPLHFNMLSSTSTSTS